MEGRNLKYGLLRSFILHFNIRDSLFLVQYSRKFAAYDYRKDSRYEVPARGTEEVSLTSRTVNTR